MESLISRPISPISILTEDCLYQVFSWIAEEPLVHPPVVEPEWDYYSPGISVQRHQNLSLLSCCLVSRSWYNSARVALHHTLIIRICERDIWYERAPTLAQGQGRHWVKKLHIVGGGNTIMGLPITPIWQLFPNITDVSIFGLGWGTGGLLDAIGPGLEGAERIWKSIQKLEITATSFPPYTLKPATKEFLQVQSFLGRLPNLHTLILCGFDYRSPVDAQIELPEYELQSLELKQCNLSMEAFGWLIDSSRHTLKELKLHDSVFWSKTDASKQTLESVINREIDAIAKRLDVALPLSVIRGT
jgi:hypothetical protein